MIEMPKLEHKGLSKAIDSLNDAWKSYSMGDMDEVLVKCRKAQQATGDYIKKAGFKSQEQKDGKRNAHPNWKKFFDSESKGDVVKNISQKISYFVSPGAHVGGNSNTNHAYFALLQTFSLVHLVISRFKMLNDVD